MQTTTIECAVVFENVFIFVCEDFFSFGQNTWRTLSFQRRRNKKRVSVITKRDEIRDVS